MLRRFLKDRGGNVAPIFGLAIVPIVALAGLAVDYSRGSSAKADIQAALDATALALSKEAVGLSERDLKTRATNYFRAVLNRPEIVNINIDPKLNNLGTGGYQLVVNGTAKINSTFALVMRKSDLDIAGVAEVKWGVKRLEVALALDNTGSMASNGKLAALKTATNNLLDTLKKAATNAESVKVAIIPFDTTVNIGTASKNEPWFDIDSIDCNGWQSGSGCNSSNWKNYWQGCVRDRKYPYDTQDDAPGSKNGTLFPVHECGELVQALPLTNDWTALKNKADEMKASGMTNVTIGLAWAWHALTQGTPYTQASAPAPDLDKVIILLTDGDNTEAWNNASNKPVTNSSHIDERTRKACENVKAANITLYTVRVINGNASLLRNCATNASTMYFDVQQASQLNAVFQKIADNLASLRLSK
jgi:Flp pilus assembly protein TadG